MPIPLSRTFRTDLAGRSWAVGGDLDAPIIVVGGVDRGHGVGDHVVNNRADMCSADGALAIRGHIADGDAAFTAIGWINMVESRGACPDPAESRQLPSTSGVSSE
jgi:hypothetical protein